MVEAEVVVSAVVVEVAIVMIIIAEVVAMIVVTVVAVEATGGEYCISCEKNEYFYYILLYIGIYYYIIEASMYLVRRIEVIDKATKKSLKQVSQS